MRAEQVALRGQDFRQCFARTQGAGGVRTVVAFAGAQHGFVFPTRSGAYEHASAERHWQRLFDLFGRRL